MQYIYRQLTLVLVPVFFIKYSVSYNYLLHTQVLCSYISLTVCALCALQDEERVQGLG